MKIKIKHSTTYKYSSTVPRLIQCLKLYPSICDNQEILDWETSTSNGKIIESHFDGLGHRVQNIFIKNFSGQLKITSQGILKTKDLSGIVKGLKEKVHPLCFLRETDLTKPCKNIEKISSEAKKNNNKNYIEFVHKLNLIVSNSIKYVSGSTTTSTCSKDALKQKKGVCQDFAHILISAARFNQFPARYVNGFLLEETTSGENTSHAWAEIFIKDLGWVAFDPSHKKCIDDKYIRISTGFDFEDASMIKGVKTNYNGDEFLDTKVDIESCQ